MNFATVLRFIPSRLAISRWETPSAANDRTCAHSNALRTSSGLLVDNNIDGEGGHRAPHPRPRKLVQCSLPRSGALLGSWRHTRGGHRTARSHARSSNGADPG